MNVARFLGALRVYRRAFLTVLLALTALCALSLIASGEAFLLGALFLGELLGALYLWTLVFRTIKSAALAAPAAKREMLWGLFLRLLALFAVLAVAANLSVRVFFAATGGFLLVYFTALFTVLVQELFRRGEQD